MSNIFIITINTIYKYFFFNNDFKVELKFSGNNKWFSLYIYLMKLSCPSCDVITAKIHYIDTKTAHKQGFFLPRWDSGTS